MKNNKLTKGEQQACVKDVRKLISKYGGHDLCYIIDSTAEVWGVSSSSVRRWMKKGNKS